MFDVAVPSDVPVVEEPNPPNGFAWLCAGAPKLNCAAMFSSMNQ